MNPFETYQADDIVRVGIAMIIFLSVFLAIMFAIWGWFLLVVSGGKEDKVKSAINHIRYAALGMLVLVLIIFIMPVFLRLFWLEGYVSFFRPDVILQTIQEISANLLNGWSAGTLLDETNNSGLPSNFTDL